MAEEREIPRGSSEQTNDPASVSPEFGERVLQGLGDVEDEEASEENQGHRAKPVFLGTQTAGWASEEKPSESSAEDTSDASTPFRPPRPGGSRFAVPEPKPWTDDPREANYLAYIAGRTLWHQQRARRRKARYLTLQLISLGAAAAIPVAAAVAAPRVVPALLGFVIIIDQGLQQLLRDHEKALAHENVGAAIARELRKYNLNTEPYEDLADALNRLMLNIEEAISNYELAYSHAEMQEESVRGS